MTMYKCVEHRGIPGFARSIVVCKEVLKLTNSPCIQSEKPKKP